MEAKMQKSTREKIEGLSELQSLINSDQWAADSQGRLERQAMDIMLAAGIDEADAVEWLHEEDESLADKIRAAVEDCGGVEVASPAKYYAQIINGEVSIRQHPSPAAQNIPLCYETDAGELDIDACIEHAE
jgi:hypothetical protein